MTCPVHPKINLRDVFLATLLILWRGKVRFSRVLLVALLLLFGLGLLQDNLEAGLAMPGVWLLDLAKLIVLCMVAVICHRLAIWGPHRLAAQGDTIWSFTTIKYILVATAAYGSYRFLTYLLMQTGQPVAEQPMLLPLLAASAMLLTLLWIVARLSLLFPALATGEDWRLRTVWQLTRHNGMRLVFLVIIIPKLVSKLPELLGIESPPFWFELLIMTGGVVFFVFEIILVSMVYRYLVIAATADSVTHHHTSTDHT